MLGMGIAVVALCLTAAGVLVLTGAIYFGYWLGRGKPNPFDKLGTGDYELLHASSSDWRQAANGMAHVLVSRCGKKKGVSYVTLPMRCLRDCDDRQLSWESMATAFYSHEVVRAEIVEKSGEHLLRLLRPASAAASATEAELDAAAALAGFAPATAEPAVPVSDLPTLIVAAPAVPPEECPASPNGHGEPEAIPPPLAQVGSL